MTASVFKCPDCGAELLVTVGESVVLPDYGGMTNFHREREQPYNAMPTMTRQPTRRARGGYRTYNQGAAAATLENWQSVSFETPARSATKEADVVVPLMQALITGAFVGAGVAIAGVGAVMAGVNLPWWAPFPAGLVTTLATAGIRWGGLLDDSRALLRKVESYVGHDLDGDGAVGAPETVALRVETTDGKRMTYDTLAHLPELRLAFQALRGGRIAHLSRRALVDIGIGSDVARDILAELKDTKYIAYPDGDNAASVLTNKGRALSRALA